MTLPDALGNVVVSAASAAGARPTLLRAGRVNAQLAAAKTEARAAKPETSSGRVRDAAIIGRPRGKQVRRADATRRRARR